MPQIKLVCPLHNSTNANAWKCSEVLLKAGAIPRKNFKDEFPQLGPLLKNQEIVTKLQNSKDMGLLPNYILVELKNQCSNTAGVVSNPIIQLCDLGGEGDFIAKQNCTIWFYSDLDLVTSEFDDPEYPYTRPHHVKKFDFVEVYYIYLLYLVLILQSNLICYRF